MNKRIFLFLGALVISLSTFAQYTITGRILDSNSRQSIDFANITLFKSSDTAPTTGTVSDTDGNFEIKNLPAGNYKINISLIGYVSIEKNFIITNKDVELPRIYLAEDTQQLSEIEVVAQGSTMRFELDRKVFSVDQNIAASGGSASDALENIPSVEVDTEGNISLRNSESVEIWINGKPAGLTADNRSQILQQMPAESIKEIELITNPSAKYSPEGTAGVINIVMKKDRKAGYYGSVSAGLIYPWGGKFGGNFGASLNFNKGIVDGYLNLGYRAMNANGSSISDRHNYNTSDTTRLYQEGYNNRSMGGFFGRAGVDVRITDKSTIGLSGFGMLGDNNDNAGINYTTYNGITENALITRHYNRLENSNGERPSYNITLDYKAEITKAQELTASASYSAHKRGNTSIYEQNNLMIDLLENSQTQTSENNNTTWEFKTDYTNKFTATSRLEAGAQVTLQERLSLASATDGNGMALPAYYNKYDYKEQLFAAYVTYGNRFWDCLSAQVGLRGEYLIRESFTNDVTNSLSPYFKLFPSAYLSYSMPNNNEMQLNYTRRVDRPRGRQLNPYRDFSDSTNISFGNGDLLPQFSSSLELNYLKNWESGQTLSAGVFYRFTDDVIQNVRYVNAESVMENTYINISKSQDVGIELVGKNRLFNNFLQLTTSVNGYYSKMDSASYTFPNGGATVNIAQQSNLAWSARLNASMMFSKTFSGQITGHYSSPRLVAQGTTTHNYSIDLGLRKTFLDRKLSVNLMARDILDSRNRSSTRWGDNFWQYSENRFMGRHIGVSVTYNFGNTRPKMKENINGNNAANDYDDNGFDGQ